MKEMKLLVLRLTERCNLRCRYCYAARDGEAPFDMEAETAIRAVELSCPVGGKLKIQFTGGEPLLKLDVMEAVHEFGRRTGRKLSMSVQTNGTLLSQEACRRIKAIRCGVGVSLDGIGKANGLRCFPDGSFVFEVVANGIRNLGGLGMQCGLTTVVTSQNAAALGQIPDLALYFGNVGGVGLDLFRPIGRGAGQELAADGDALEAGLRSLKKKVQELNAAGIAFRFRELERVQKRKTVNVCADSYCYAQTDASLCVDGHGDMWPCSSLAGDRRFYLGNLKDGLPEKNRDAIEGLKAPSVCYSCDSYVHCLGGCPAARQEAINPLVCRMHHILSEES